MKLSFADIAIIIAVVIACAYGIFFFIRSGNGGCGNCGGDCEHCRKNRKNK